MAYHTGLYLFLFLPAALAAYQMVPQRHRWKILLLFGYLFFYLISGELLLYLLGTTAFTYLAGQWIESAKRERKRWVLTLGVTALLGVLGYLKYAPFLVRNLNFLAEKMLGGELFTVQKLLLPVGISFYTLQAVGYLADVYWGKIKAETHPGKLALFLGFFPQIMEQISSGKGRHFRPQTYGTAGRGSCGDSLRSW